MEMCFSMWIYSLQQLFNYEVGAIEYDYNQFFSASEAVAIAEEYLNQSMTKEFYSFVVGDCVDNKHFHDRMCRGDMLGSMRYIEFQVTKNSCIL